MHMGTTPTPRPCPRQSCGSPPCTWGQRGLLIHPLRRGQFTPMHMGTTPRPRLVGGSVSVHPHAHGDNSLCVAWPLIRVGSPPCTWGQRRRRGREVQSVRFTPMHMGTTAGPDKTIAGLMPVHPHAHGDNGPRYTRCVDSWSVHPHAHGDNPTSRCWREGWIQDVAPRSRQLFGSRRHRCGRRSPARPASSTLAGRRRHDCRQRLSAKSYPVGGPSYGRGISRPSVRSSTGSGPPAAPAAPFPGSARPCNTSSMSGRMRSNRRVF